MMRAVVYILIVGLVITMPLVGLPLAYIAYKEFTIKAKRI